MADPSENLPGEKAGETSEPPHSGSLDVEAGLAAAFGTEARPDGIRDQPRSVYQPGVLVDGKFRLIEPIGEGGMGTVWYAEQTAPIKRKVALKLIKPGLDSRTVLSRFDAERQALALMDHPNIAKVFDGGITDRGHPYFVMELVRGTSLTAFCDERRLALHERIGLFVSVCQAIQHAHQKGVIHRDIKPSNIMVALYDGKPVPKVIDFGVAKAIGSSLTDASLHTEFGAVVGTAEYMSPEQAELNNLDIDTRSDVYSLGVLMYELLSGSPPFPRAELAVKGLHEILRVIREDDPQRPSAKLSTSKMRASIAALRGIEPDALGKLLRGDLDWIAMKSLEKDRSRRYESPHAMARDLERYLRNEPVDACPPSARYRIRKFLRRYRWQAAGTGLLLATLIAGIVGTSVGFFRAESQRRIAVKAQMAADDRAEGERQAKLDALRQKEIAEAAEEATLESYRASTDDAIEQLIGSKPQLGQLEREYLENALKRWQEFADRKGNDPRSRAVRGEAHLRVGSIWESLGQTIDAQSELEQAAAIWGRLVAEFPTVPGHRSSLARCHHNLGLLLAFIGEKSKAADQLRQAQVIKEALVDEFPAVVEYRVLLARNHENLGNIQRDLGSLGDAELQHRQALAIRAKLIEEFPAEPKMRNGLAASHFNLAIVLQKLGNHSQAEEHYRAALTEFEKLAKEFPVFPSYRHRLAACQQGLGQLLRNLNRLDEAEGLLRAGTSILESLTAEFPSLPEYQKDLARIHQHLGNLLLAANRKTEAESHYRTSVAITERLAAQFPAVPAYRADLADSYYNLALLMKNLDMASDAEDPYRRAQAIQEALVRQLPLVPAYRDNLAGSHNGLASLLVEMGKTAEAEVEYRKALAIRENLAVDYPAIRSFTVELGGSYCNLGHLLRNGGKAAESLELFDKAIGTLRPIHDADTRATRARNYLRNGHWGRAKAQLTLGNFSASDWDRAIELTPDDRQPDFRIRKLIARFRSGDQTAAISDLDILKEWLDKIPEDRLYSNEWFDLACMLSFAANRRPEQEDALLDQAVEMLQRAVRAGFADKQLALQDSSLEPIRNRAEFGELMEKISRQNETKEK